MKWGLAAPDRWRWLVNAGKKTKATSGKGTRSGREGVSPGKRAGQDETGRDGGRTRPWVRGRGWRPWESPPEVRTARVRPAWDLGPEVPSMCSFPVVMMMESRRLVSIFRSIRSSAPPRAGEPTGGDSATASSGMGAGMMSLGVSSAIAPLSLSSTTVQSQTRLPLPLC